ncbi:Polyphenol oxidase [Quillaja saponaria]|uniref:Polyphenol oxidase n=1 Tax=Quillaja saponaria TaxID=32244 RepID=A0AAD7P9S4_QUISA|nr:Polyphenol oxidase [Quillaja saponaria]
MATSSTILITPSFYPFFQRKTQKSKNKVIPLKASKNDQENPTPAAFKGKFDRRDLLLGSLGGICGATSATNFSNKNNFALAAPITTDINNCSLPTELPSGVNVPFNCCPPPNSKKILDFSLPASNSLLRVRPAAHLVDDEYVRKYSKAIELMKALHDDDPRSFLQQANVHCAYCEGSYKQDNYDNLQLQIHSSWLFFPWHRYYLYFYDKILASLIKDPTFALPFWNWDSPPGMQMPRIFLNEKSSLYNVYRNAKHQSPNVLIDLDYSGTDLDITNEQHISKNLIIMYRQMVSNAKTAKLFFGQPYRAGDEENPGAGSIENLPHNNVHEWSGDPTQPNNEDMGNFNSAARDPMFFSHHSNIDRMWTIWETLPGKNRKLYTDPDWLNASFLFYDENAQLVRVKIKDSLDNTKLGYKFQDVKIPWLNARPTPRRLKLEKKSYVTTFPKILETKFSVSVPRPRKSRSAKEKEDEEEILVVEGIEFEITMFLKFDVYDNDEVDSESGQECREFCVCTACTACTWE